MSPQLAIVNPPVDEYGTRKALGFAFGVNLTDKLSPEGFAALAQDLAGLAEELTPQDQEPDLYGAASELRRRIGGYRNLYGYVTSLLAGQSRKRRNPAQSAGGVIFGREVHEIRYDHVTQGPMVHKFGAGVRAELLPDGSVRLFHKSRPVAEDFPG